MELCASSWISLMELFWNLFETTYIRTLCWVSFLNNLLNISVGLNTIVRNRYCIKRTFQKLLPLRPCNCFFLCGPANVSSLNPCNCFFPQGPPSVFPLRPCNCFFIRGATTVSPLKALQVFFPLRPCNCFFIRGATTVSSFEDLQLFFPLRPCNCFFPHGPSSVFSFEALQLLLHSRCCNCFFIRGAVTVSSFEDLQLLLLSRTPLAVIQTFRLVSAPISSNKSLKTPSTRYRSAHTNQASFVVTPNIALNSFQNRQRHAFQSNYFLCMITKYCQTAHQFKQTY